MKVKLLRDGLYGNENRTAGEVLDLPDDLARDVAARGDGLLVMPKVAQLVPAFGAVELPTIYEDDEPEAPAASETPAPEVPPASESEVPAAPIPPAPVKPSPRAVLAK